MNTFQRIMVLTMIATGSLNTITASLQLARPAMDSSGEYSYFDHYFVQTLFMMLGECLCMVAYLIMKHVVHRKNPELVDGPNPIPMNPLVLWPAAFLDIIGTSCDYMGLGLMRNPGFQQMLRATPIVFCALLSIPFLGKRLKAHNWSGIGIVVVGLAIKAIPDAMAGFGLTHDDLPSIIPEDVEEEWHLCNAGLTGRVNGSESWTTTLAPATDCGDSTMDATTRVMLGIVIVIIGEFFHGCQFVYEEKYLTKYNLPPLKVVGLEGINGFLTLCLLLWPMYFIDIGCDFGLGPRHTLEDMIDGLKMIFDSDAGFTTWFANMHYGVANGGWLLAWTLGNMCSIAVFNFAGITVTKELSATTRAVLDQIRIVIIWVIFFIPFGPTLCAMHTHFVFTGPIGLILLMAGVFVYNDVIIMPAYRKYIKKEEPSPVVTEKDLEMSTKE